MKRILAIGVILLFIGSISSSTGINLEKNPTIPLLDENTLYVGGSGPGNYTKIQDASDNASSGDTIFVYDDSAPYYENLVIDKSINLTGENKETTIIDGNYLESVITIKCKYATIQGATYSAISGFTIQNSGNEFWDSGIEMEFYQCSFYYIISNNIIRSNQNGIFLFCTCDSNITNNIIIDNQYGIILSGARMLGECRSNNILDNIISNNSEYGIICYERVYSTFISNNIIINNNIGIEINYDTHNSVCIGNHISKNRVGLITNPVNTVVKRNNFIENEKSAIQYFNSRYGENTIFDGNYWDKPRTYPYPIPRRIGLIIFMWPWFPLWDWHPAKEPYDIEV